MSIPNERYSRKGLINCSTTATGRVNLTASPSYTTKFYMRFDNAIMHKHNKN